VVTSTHPGEEAAWAQGVLLTADGYELNYTDVEEEFLGEYVMTFGDDEYVVTVEQEKIMNWEQVVEAAGEDGKDLLAIIRPYWPALQRQGKEAAERFFQQMQNGQWDAIDREMYAGMTADERAALNDQVYQGARAAALDKYANREMLKSVLSKIALNLLVKLATGGLG
jgi:hypothetical protein